MTTVSLGGAFAAGRRAALPARASALYMAAGAVAIGVYFLVPAAAQDVLYGVIGVSAVAAIYVGGIRGATEERRAWECFAVGLICEVAGDTISSVYELSQGHDPPVPSIADAFYLSGYPLLALGVFLLLRGRGGTTTLPSIIDALTICISSATVQWIFFVEPYFHVQLGNGQRAVSMAYPSLDVLLFAALAQLLLGVGGRRPSYRLLIASVALWVAGDEIYALTAGHYAAGSWVDSFWLASYVAWGGAALALMAEPRPLPVERRTVPRLTRARVVVLSVALLAIPAALLVEQARGRQPHTIAAAIGATLLAVMIMLRMGGLVRVVERARLDERSARHDAELAGRQIEAQNAELRELDRLKDEFLSSVSHELRTPLTSIAGYVELLLEGAKEEERSHLEVVERNASRLLGLVSDLLFAARLQSGRLALDAGAVDLRELAAQAVESARPPADTAGVALTAHLRDVPAVRGESDRLAQLIDNLISNAIKFTGHGGSVDVSVAAAGDVVRVEVADTGIGLSDDDRAHLFERFFRAPGALDRQIPGTGLGLYISKAIVDAHEGRISVGSTPSGGTSFVVELPVA
ncbi:MAG: HAMP domain-containing histidine kinase [Actinobacteria bacterium]|nr:HAMP domain-containing histidine kinase [Actinomycetota bacterium]